MKSDKTSRIQRVVKLRLVPRIVETSLSKFNRSRLYLPRFVTRILISQPVILEIASGNDPARARESSSFSLTLNNLKPQNQQEFAIN